MKRRRFIQYGAAGTAAIGAAGFMPGLFNYASAQTPRFEFSIEPVEVDIFPGQPKVYMLAFKNFPEFPNPPAPTGLAFDLVDKDHPDRHLPPVPGPLMVVREGDFVQVQITNRDIRPHQFRVEGAVTSEGAPIEIQSPIILPGDTVPYAFHAPAARTYLYHDPLNFPVNRLMGLHGALVVKPPLDFTPPFGSNPTPYTTPTPNIQRLFDDLGRSFLLPGETEVPFPGEKWLPDEPTRNFVWIMNDIDPRLNERVRAGKSVWTSRELIELVATFLPRFFTINGECGHGSAHAPWTRPENYEGMPTMIRILNAGLAVHGPHIHGNHIYELRGGSPTETSPVDPDTGLHLLPTEITRRPLGRNVGETDTWNQLPMEVRENLLPYHRPNDAYPWPAARFQFGIHGMPFPMHCHVEMSQTAAGGNYPQGAITDWVLLDHREPPQPRTTGNRFA